jgi:hypothetical protein
LVILHAVGKFCGQLVHCGDPPDVSQVVPEGQHWLPQAMPPVGQPQPPAPHDEPAGQQNPPQIVGNDGSLHSAATPGSVMP